ncbi:uncharacterized protein LOC122257537 [Penaeus japonicus]|uniref:uncharacterized protein LOC122257537 n=1 Tax=Penaeus japonicus TaxID=27405 RepID=UPI001C70C31E|nr:uncharacterized protein LOC122257537 [Penaeus japonicus]
MASRDVLSLSLDDIIRMKHGGRGGKGGGRGGRGRGGRAQAAAAAASASAASAAATPRRNAGGVRGRGRGVRVLSSKLNNRGMARGRGSAAMQGKQLVSRGRGANVAVRGRGSQRGNARGISRGRRALTTRQIDNTTLDANRQRRGRDAAVKQQLMKRKIQQARRTLAASQQNNRKQARLNAIDTRRGITGGVKQTKGNLGTPLKVRVGNGTVVRGLRSDQLLLHKMRQRQKIDVLKDKKGRTQQVRDPSRGTGAVVSLSSQRGLTVSIKNNIASTQSAQNGARPRQRPRLNRNRVYQNSSAGYAPPTFTVVNEHVHQPPPEPSFQVSDMPRKFTKRNIITSRDPRARVAAMTTAPLIATVAQETVRSLPEPHRQILDPKVQKEIAMLQGKNEVTLNSGPGPGVKGFRHVPNQTSRSLNERFTEERMVTA